MTDEFSTGTVPGGRTGQADRNEPGFAGRRDEQTRWLSVCARSAISQLGIDRR